MKYVYEVWSDTPCGAWSHGLYQTDKSATRVAKKLNKNLKCEWDRACISKRKVKP